MNHEEFEIDFLFLPPEFRREERHGLEWLCSVRRAGRKGRLLVGGAGHAPAYDGRATEQVVKECRTGRDRLGRPIVPGKEQVLCCLVEDAGVAEDFPHPDDYFDDREGAGPGVDRAESDKMHAECRRVLLWFRSVTTPAEWRELREWAASSNGG